MSTRIGRAGRLLRSQSVAVLALCLAVSGGTAYAVAGRDSVVSSSIRDGAVRTADLAPGGITSTQVEGGSLTGADLAPDALGGVQVDESGLSELALAAQGGRGRVSGTGTCDPESTALVRCAVVSISLVRRGRVLVLGSMTHRSDGPGAGVTRALCRVRVDGVGFPDSELEVLRSDGAGRRAVTPVTWLTPQLLAGDHIVELACGEASGGTLTVERARVAVVALSGL